MLNDRVLASQAKDFGVKSGETNTTSKFVNENIRSDKYINKNKNIRKSMININIDETNKESNEPNEKIYVKSYPGAKIADIQDHVKPSQRYEPNLITLSGLIFAWINFRVD